MSSLPEASTTYLVCARNTLDGIDEATDNGLSNALAMFRQPRTKRGHHINRFFCLVDYSLLLFGLQRRLDALQELNRQGVALVDVWDVAVEAGFGIVVGEQSDVLELPSEDVDQKHHRLCSRFVRGFGDVGRDAADGVFAAAGRPAVHGARDAAAAEAGLTRHSGCDGECWW